MLLNEADKVYFGALEADRVYRGSTKVWEKPSVSESWGPDEMVYGAGTANPDAPGDPNTFSVGARFTVLADGRITGLRHYTMTGSLATRHVALWTDAGVLLGSGMATATAPGWNVYPITPVNVTAGQIFRSSHGYSGNGIDGAFPFSMTTTNLGSTHLRFEGGVYSDAIPSGGEDDFPNYSILPNHYFGDVVYQKRESAVTQDIPPLVELTPLPRQPEPPGGWAP